MVKSTMKFIIEDRDGELFFIASTAGGKVYEAHISNQEVDIFDCIETFMSEYNNLFRGKSKAKSDAYHRVAPLNSALPPIEKIKWTSTTTD
jgi:hypothetical protein